MKGALYLVTSTDPAARARGLYRLEAEGPRRLLDLPTRYTLGLAVEEGP